MNKLRKRRKKRGDSALRMNRSASRGRGERGTGRLKMRGRDKNRRVGKRGIGGDRGGATENRRRRGRESRENAFRHKRKRGTRGGRGV